MITKPAPRPTPGDAAGIRPTLRLVSREASLDAGLAAVQAAHDALGIDASWSLEGGRGFTWRVGGLVQRVWSEAKRPGPDGVGARWRVLAETEVVRDVAEPALAAEMCNLLNGIGSMGALVADPARRTIVHRAAAWVSETGSAGAGSAAPASDPGAAARFALAVTLQASEAASLASLLAGSSRGEVARPLHPGFAARVGGSDPVLLDELIAAGRERSAWSDGCLLRARHALASESFGGALTADAWSLSMPVPMLGGIATLLALTADAHPVLGHGLHVRLHLSLAAAHEPTAEVAAELNRLEAGSAARADLYGAWVAAAGRLQHVAFYPNAAHTT
ncbi:MAG: hypothetical protein U0869_26350, partial [Chloroflexota bacterium]